MLAIYLFAPPHSSMGFPCGSAGKKIHLQYGRSGFDLWVGRSPGEGNGSTHSNILAWRIPWTYIAHGISESDMTEQLSLSLFFISFYNKFRESERIHAGIIELIMTFFLLPFDTL